MRAAEASSSIDRSQIERLEAQNEAVRVRNLCKNYGDCIALSDLSFTLKRGQTLVVFGANGAGKTTLLRLLATLERPDQGEISLFGQIFPADPKVRAEIGLLSHSSFLYQDLSPSENLRYFANLYGIDIGYCEELLALTGMSSQKDEPVRSLSRGDIQRVAICRTLLNKPRLLLLDEPFANLDPAGFEQILPLIMDSGFTRIITSHSIEEGIAQADIVMGIKDGRLAIFDSAQNVTPLMVREIYIRSQWPGSSADSRVSAR